MTSFTFTGGAAYSTNPGDFSWDLAGNWADDAVPTILTGDIVTLAPYSIDRNTTNVLVTDSGTLSNAGTIILSPNGSTADYFMQFELTGDLKLTGGGEFRLTGTSVSPVDVDLNGFVFENAGNTIDGLGMIDDRARGGGGVFTNDSSGIVDANDDLVALSLNVGAINNAGSLEATAAGGLSLSGNIHQSASGKILADGGDVTIVDGSTIVGGKLSATSGSEIVLAGQLDGTGALPVTISKGTFVEAEALELIAASGQTAAIANWGTISVGTAAAGNIWINGSIGGVVRLSGGGIVEMFGSKVIGGLLDNVDNTIDGQTVFTNIVKNEAKGVIDANIAGGLISFETSNTVINNGLLKADAGTLEVNDAVTGSGSAVVTHGGTLQFNSTFDENIAFAGVGAVSFATAYSGTISGLGVGDTITLQGITADAAFVNGSNQLVMTNAGVVVDQIQLGGDNSGLSFLAVASDGTTVVSVALPLNPTVAQYLARKTYYDSQAGGVHIVDSAANIVAALPKLNADPLIASLTATSGSAALQAGAHIVAPAFSLSGAGTNLTIVKNLIYGGAFNEGSGASITIYLDRTLSLTGTNTLSGATSGLGTLKLQGGTTTIAASATISTQYLKLAGSGTTAAFAGDFNYFGFFQAGSQSKIVLNGGDLWLAGYDILFGATVTGAHTIGLAGLGYVAGLKLVGSSDLENAACVVELGASLILGDTVAADQSVISNAAGAVWTIADNSGIVHGGGSADYVANSGLFEKTGGSGVSGIGAAFVNNGFVAVDAGTLDFKGAVSGVGSDSILGAAPLEFDASVAASQNVSFSSAGGELFLGGPMGFQGQIAGFDMIGGGANDTLALSGAWTLDHFVENSASTSGVLNLTSGSKHIGLNLAGTYLDGHFAANAGPGNSTLITYA